MECIVVEDDPFWMAEICDALASEAARIHQATSGAVALRLLADHPKAVMVLDVILPDQDGLEVLKAAREVAPDMRALVISGGGRLPASFYLQLADAFGADIVLEKPFTHGQLVARWRDLTSPSLP
jgi:DNA-binding response OmpR family regulator